MDSYIQDPHYAVHPARKSPAIATVAVLTPAFGIGANTAIFGVVYAPLLRPLPFPGPRRLIQLWHVPPKSFAGFIEFAVSAANYVDWGHQSHSFEQLATYSFARLNLTGLSGNGRGCITGVLFRTGF